MKTPAQRISIVVPTLNEAGSITPTLERVQRLRDREHEVVVVDGGSTDDTVRLAAPFADRVIAAPRGRARQMNAGAAAAAGDLLLFLHADTLLPPDADRLILEGVAASGRGWGRFDVRLSGSHPMLRVIERGISWRSRITGIATGDQAIFVTRRWWERIGGYPDLPLMEDLALSRALRKMGRPLCISQPVITSSRRWEERGVWPMVLLMWRLRLAYYLGADPARLARRYH